MKIKFIKALAGKELKRLVREPANLFMVILLPLVSTVAFGASFGAIGGGESTYPIAVVNLDSGEWSRSFDHGLSAVEILTVQAFSDNATAQQELTQGRVKAVLIIPSDFSASVDSFSSNPANPKSWHNTTLALSIDKGSMIASAAIPPVIQQVLSVTIYGKQAEIIPMPVRIGTPNPVEAEHVSQFAFMAPGLFSFAAIFLIMTISQSLTEEREKGLIRRISVTQATTSDVFASQIVANSLIGALQVVIILFFASVMGFRPLGGVYGFVFAFALIMMLTLCSVGFGIITAAIARNSGVATGLSFIFILPQLFLGTFVPAPESVARLVPTYYVTDALATIFLRGAPLDSPVIISDLAIISIMGMGVIAIGIIIFRRLGKT